MIQLRVPGRWRLWLAALVLLIVCPRAEAAEQRIALVIGNGGYEKVVRLGNPPADAKLIARTLAGLGFKVTELIDANQTAMKAAIAQFGRALRAAGPETVGLFYYAGHGVQASGVNYLLPIDSDIRDEADLDLVGVEGSWVVRQMESARNITNIVILDACRSNPFAAMGATGQGLARMDAPTGTFIAYSTAPGSVALDGSGGNSPFTAALAAAVAQPALPVEEVFKQVRVRVLKETGGAQTPWDSSSLVRDFVFRPAQPSIARDDPEQQAWATASASSDPAQILKFMQAYPRSLHTDEAQALLKAVSGRASASPQIATAQQPARASATIRFSTPLSVGAPGIDGNSIEQLIRGVPHFPPIEGLPPEIWQGKHCTACHKNEWTQKTLCDQGQFYVRTGEARMLSVKHPFGNPFGTALRDWALSGCH